MIIITVLIQQITAVRAVLYCILRFISCLGTFEIRIAFKNEKYHIINKMIGQIIVVSKFKFSFRICENEFQSWAFLQYVHLEPNRTGVKSVLNIYRI